MIRVLQIVTYMGRGGLETMLMNYYRHMDRTKVQFDFLVHRDFEADYDEEIRALGGKIYHVSRLIPWSVSYRAELKAFFHEHPEYRIVHVHQDCLSSVALQCAKECGVPVRIAHSHNSSQDKNLKYLIKRYYMRKIPEYATDLLACGKMAGEWMFGGKPFQILRNAVDAEKYQYSPSVAAEMRRELQLKEEVVIGHVGQFRLQKNHEFLIDIFAECVKLNPQVKLILAGDGDTRKKVEEKVSNLGLQEKVLFLGVRTDIDRLLQVMDVFVFPSLYEGLPVTLIEAQAAGLPCVIADHITEECIVTGSLVKKRNLEEPASDWARQALQCAHMARESHVEEIRAAGFDIAEAAAKLENFYLQKAGE
ncbi:MAG: glycosyltransferase family 1 protein [Fusicatenibacter sp.]|nr:glycosyltransferase family 1 protein [Fusicatenibacter sp.]